MADDPKCQQHFHLALRMSQTVEFVAKTQVLVSFRTEQVSDHVCLHYFCSFTVYLQ